MHMSCPKPILPNRPAPALAFALFLFLAWIAACTPRARRETPPDGATPIASKPEYAAAAAEDWPGTLPWPVAPAQGPLEPVQTILMPETHPEWAALAAPVAAAMRTETGPARILVLPETTARPWNNGMPPFSSVSTPDALFLTPDHPSGRWAENVTVHHGLQLTLPDEPGPASLRLAQAGWGRTEQAVFCASYERALLSGAVFAAHRALPLLVVPFGDDGTFLREACDRLGIRRGWWIGAFPRRDQSHEPTLEHLTPDQAAALLDDTPHDAGLLIAAVPNLLTRIAETGWIAPYLSILRLSPVLLAESSDPEALEDHVLAWTRHHRRAPRSILLLGDEFALGLKTVSLPPLDTDTDDARTEPPNGMDIQVEPFTYAPHPHALTFAVGRLPYAALAPTAHLVDLIRQRGNEHRPDAAHALLVANPNPAYGNLPLCETVSRATERELRNARVPTRAFYGKIEDPQALVAALEKTHLILYEGHLNDQRLFDDPAAMALLDAQYEAYEDGEESMYEEEYPSEDPDPWPPRTVPYDPRDPPVPRPEGTVDDPWRTNQPPDEPFPESHLPTQLPPPSLHGLPVVMLQSCQSLERDMLLHLQALGCTALVGSTTNVHSASGSTFLKALLDQALYRNATLGEALRDARNYMFCLVDLKAKRGHNQQAKGLRVALSFRLWGDPEMRLVPPDLRPPRLAPAHVAWSGPEPHAVVLRLPDQRLPTSQNDSYRLRAFPGSATAGIVKRSKKDGRRRILPMHYHVLDIPEELQSIPFTPRDPDADETRLAWRRDPLGQRLHLLSFPDRERPNDVIRFPITQP